MRGQIYDIDGKRFFALGGAESHDRGFRVAGKSWWKEELPSQEELDEATRNLENADFDVDFVITHCAPTSVQSLLSKDYRPDRLTERPKIEKDPKSTVKEYCEKRQIPYEFPLLSESGPDHAKEYRVACKIDGKEVGFGIGKSKKLADRHAAEDAISRHPEILKQG